MSNENQDVQKTVQEKHKLSEEVARAQMQDFMDSYDIDPADLAIENGPEWVATVVNRLVRAVRSGKLELMADGTVKQNYTTSSGTQSSISYRRMNGTAMKERDKAKGVLESDLALMSSLGNVSPSILLDLDIVDISVWQRLAQLFMVV
jgi:hypothetical protein